MMVSKEKKELLDQCITTNFRAKHRRKTNVFQKIVVVINVWQILIKPSHLGTITGKRTIYQKIVISINVWHILIRPSYLRTLTGKRKMSSRK
jgi:hypothetical protein